jgi:hypothetical protein
VSTKIGFSPSFCGSIEPSFHPVIGKNEGYVKKANKNNPQQAKYQQRITVRFSPWEKARLQRGEERGQTQFILQKSII